MNPRALMALLLLLIPASLRADPITIVDTGRGPTGFPALELSSLQSLAVKFPVAEAVIITSAEGWMTVTGSGFLDVVLYGDGGETPGEMLFRSTGFIDRGNADWRGVSNLAWAVTTGMYWLGFEPTQFRPVSAAMPIPSPRPLRDAAVINPELGTRAYQEADGAAQMGVRILGEPATAATPEPGAILLVATGVAGLIARRRRQ